MAVRCSQHEGSSAIIVPCRDVLPGEVEANQFVETAFGRCPQDLMVVDIIFLTLFVARVNAQVVVPAECSTVLFEDLDTVLIAMMDGFVERCSSPSVSR
jgi:hypothetical protein